MAKARFTLPADPRPPAAEGEDLNGAPPVVPPCAYLREKATGTVHVYSEEMAKRGDLVEACDDPQAQFIPPAPPPPPAPPATPARARRAESVARDIPHTSVGLNLHATEPGSR
ncbi:hypothetical protein [Paraburkholderia dinghuensis]|uniref:Uncharacterized protein n=1 Tax=Paraburkholderia dinghuensis TaxID=2305225 RepID=A0A3N6NDM8_9BURK|nr:hypothetical protein [Paraburkholderia dinghuensis]RQH06627.1 hypothetical protein D1Y85_12200 [Paraburkholderia dinghuensis]